MEEFYNNTVHPMYVLLSCYRYKCVLGTPNVNVEIVDPYYASSLLRVTYFGNFHGLDLAGVSDVRAAAQIDERAAAVHSGGRCRDALVQQTLLELVILNMIIK